MAELHLERLNSGGSSNVSNQPSQKTSNSGGLHLERLNPASAQATPARTAYSTAAQMGSTGTHEYVRGRRNIDAVKKATSGRMTNSGTRRQFIDKQLVRQNELEQLIAGSSFSGVQNLINQYKDIASKTSSLSSKMRDIERMNPYDAGLAGGTYQANINKYTEQAARLQKELERFGITVNGAAVDSSRYNQIYFDSLKPNAGLAAAEYIPANGLLKDNTTLNVEEYLGHVGADEMQLYNYLASSNPEEADVYRQYLDNLVQQRIGGERTEQILDKYTAGGVALSRGTEAFKSGVAGAYNAMVATATGNDKKTSASEYAAEQLRADLASKGDEWWRTAGFDIMQSIGTMTPGVVAGMVNPNAGMAVFGATTGTMAYQEKLAEGWSADEARRYGLMIGTSEAALGKLLGGIPALGGAEGGLLAKLTGNVNNALAKIVLNRVGEMGSEALEEGLQTIIAPAIESAVRGTPYDMPELKEIAYSAVLGAITSAGFGAPSFVAESADAVSPYTANKQNQYRYGADAQTLVNEAKQIKDIKPTVDRAQKRLDKGKNISNATAKTLITTANRSRVVDAVETQINVRAGEIDEKTARSLANAIVAKTRNEGLTQNQQKLIAKHEKLASTLEKELDPKKPAEWAQTIGVRGAEEASYGNRNVANAVEAVENKVLTGGEYAEARKNLVEKGQDKIEFTEDFDYVAEVHGNTRNYERFDEVWNAIKDDTVLTEDQARAAWQAGKEKLLAADTNARLTRHGTGKVSFGELEDGDVTYMAPEQDEIDSFKRGARYQYLEALAKKVGVDIVFFKAGDEDINGKYLNGTVYLAIDASPTSQQSVEGYVMLTAAHELTHYIKEASPARYAELKDFVIKHIIDKGKLEGKNLKQLIMDKRNAYARAGVELSVDAAIEEIVADACEMMLKDNTLVAQLKGENATLHGKISKWLKKFMAMVRKAFEGLEAHHVEAKAMEDSFRELQRIWNLGLTEAAQAEVMGESNSGESKYSFAGRKSETANQSRYQKAVDMEKAGKDSETIRKQTGWFKGMDGQWRYEIDDGSAEFLLPQLVEKLNAKVQAKIDKIEADYKAGKFGRQAYLNRINTARNRFQTARWDFFQNTHTVGELLKHPKLYAAYPFIKDVTVSFRDMPSHLLGIAGENEITLPEWSYDKPNEIAETLAHEIQHIIQDYEGFATGSSVKYWQRRIDNGAMERDYERSAYDLYYQTAGEIEARDTAARLALTAEQRKNTRPDIDREDVVFAEITKGEYTLETIGKFSPGSEGVVESENGEPVAMSTEDGSVRLSIKTYEDSGRDAFRNYLEKCVSSNRLTEAEMQEMLDGIEEIYQVCKKFKDEYAPFSAWSDAEVIRDTYGKPVFSVVTPNGDYKMNLDFSLVCRKRRTLDAVFNEMTRRGIIDDFELGQKSVVRINEIIRKHGFETACALCFVDAKRFRQAAMADSFVQLYNELVKSLVPGERLGEITHFNFGGNEGFRKAEAGKSGINALPDKELDFSHIRDVMREYGKGTVEYKAAKYILENAEGRKLLFRGDFMSSAGFDEVKINNKNILKLYNSKKGTGGPKAAFGDVQYMNEILSKSRTWTPGKAYDVGGVRVQSFSDYVPRMVFDYVQMIYDLAAAQLPAHAYTKEALFVKQFGLTGIKINMSLIPAIADDGIAPGLDARGNYVWAGESFDYATAIEVQNAEGYTENCGTICVGVSDEHIRKLIDDPNIRMVIPYHKSGLNPIVAHMNRVAAFTDYTDKQRTKGSDGVAVKKDFDFNKELHRMGADGDPKLVAQMYLDWCADNGYTPKFADFADRENYYKLLIDFTVYDKSGMYVPQREVRGVFPKKGDAFGDMSQLIRSGLEEDAVIEGRRVESIGSIVDEIVRSIPKAEADIAEVQVAQAEGDVEAAYARDMSGGKYSLKSFSPRQVENWKNSKRIVIYENETQLRAFIQDVRDGLVDNKKMYFGIVPENMAEDILANTGINVENFNISLSSNEIKKIFKEHGVEEKEKLRGQRAVTDDDMVNIPYVLENANVIERSDQDYNGKPAILFRTAGNERTNVVAVVSDKHLDLFVQTMYINVAGNKKGNLATPTDEQASANTPGANSGTVSNFIIENDDGFVNAENQRFSIKDDAQSDRMLLANALMSVAQNDAERRRLNNYKKQIDTIEEIQALLYDKENELSRAYRAKDKAEIAKVQRERDALREKLIRADSKLTELQATKPLKDLLKRVKQDTRRRTQISRRETRSKAELRNKIKTLHKQMSNQLLKPSENKYVPKPLLRTVAELLEEINLDSGRSEKIKAKLTELSGQYKKIAESNESYVYDPVIAEMIANLQSTIATMDDSSIYHMSRENLQMVYDTMKAINHTVRNAVKMIGYEENRNIFELAKAMIHETTRTNPVANKQANKYINATLRPDVFFKRMGGYVKNSVWQMMGDMLNAAQLRQLQIQMEGAAFFEELMREEDKLKEMCSPDRLIDIGLKDEFGETVRVTMDIALKIYMDTMAEDNARHLMYGGYTVPNMREFYKGKPSEAFDLGSVSVRGFGPLFHELEHNLRHAETEEEAAEIQQKIEQAEADAADWVEKLRQNIREQMGEYELRWVEAAERFFNEYSQRVLNETTMAVYGFAKATVPYYVPIHTDAAYRQANFESISRDFSLENSGFMKQRVKASNPMLAEGLVDVVSGQIDRVAKYAGMMPGIRNFEKVYGKTTGGFENSVQRAVGTKFGKEARKYIENLITDLTAPRRTEGGMLGEFADQLRGKLASAALTLNPRVTFEQFTSYPKAASVIGYEPLLKALRDVRDNPVLSEQARQEIAQWSPLMWYRTQGLFNREMGDIRGDDILKRKTGKAMDFLLKSLEFTEGATVGQMWYAAQYYVEDNTNLERGTDAFMQETAKVFNRIVMQTQANYTTMQRPDILRNPNAIVKQLTMFMTERLQNANMVFDAVGTYNAYLRDFKNGANDVTAEDLREAKLGVARTASSLIAATASSVALKLIVDAIMYNMKGYRDEDEELTMASVNAQLLENFFESVAGNFLWGSEIFAVMRSVITGETYYGISLGGVENFTDAVDAVVKAAQEPSKESLWKLAKSAAQMLGIPANNAIKIYNSYAYRIKDVQEGNGWGTYASEVKMTDEKRNKQLYEALLDGNQPKIDRLFEHYGTEAAADAALAKHIKSLYMSDELSEKEAIAQLEELASMSAYDAKLTIDKLRFEKEQGFAYEDMKQQYLEGIITGEDAVKFKVDYGDVDKSAAEGDVNQWRMEKETGLVYSKVSSYLASGDIDDTTAIKYLMNYGGYDSEEAAAKKVSEWMGEIETGIPADQVEDYYAEGLISRDFLINYYMNYKWWYDEETANRVADKRDFVGKDDRINTITPTAVEAYNEYLADADIDKYFYYTAWKERNAIQSGGEVNGKKYSRDVLRLFQIDKYNLQPWQKTLLAQAFEISDKNISRYAPWA